MPVVATAHMYRRALLWYAVFAPLVRIAVRRIDALLAVSPAAAEYARRGTGREVEVVPNGIDHAALAGARRRTAAAAGSSSSAATSRARACRCSSTPSARLAGDAELVLVGPSQVTACHLARG